MDRSKHIGDKGAPDYDYMREQQQAQQQQWPHYAPPASQGPPPPPRPAAAMSGFVHHATCGHSWRGAVLEGTAAFFSAMLVARYRTAGTLASADTAAFAAGLVLALCCGIWRGVTGNAAVLLTELLGGYVNYMQFLYSLVAQFAGAVVGVVWANYVLDQGVSTAVPAIVGGSTTLAAVMAEITGCFLVIATWMIVQHTYHFGLHALLVGAAGTLAVLLTGAVTTSAMSPLYALAACIISGVWPTGWWIFAFMPFVASVGALLVLLFLHFGRPAGITEKERATDHITDPLPPKGKMI